MRVNYCQSLKYAKTDKILNRNMYKQEVITKDIWGIYV